MYRSDKMENLIETKKDSLETFENLVSTVKLKLYKTAMSILKNDDDACDAIQETLLSAYKNIDKLKNKHFFSTWIIRIIMDENSSYYDMYKEDSILENVLNQIDKDLKLVTVLYYYDDFPIKEISEIINIPEGTVKSRLSRARTQIYDILKKEEGEN